MIARTVIAGTFITRNSPGDVKKGVLLTTQAEGCDWPTIVKLGLWRKCYVPMSEGAMTQIAAIGNV
jgi:hypothetical protein